jgi:hypothetical protein
MKQNKLLDNAIYYHYSRGLIFMTTRKNNASGIY